MSDGNWPVRNPHLRTLIGFICIALTASFIYLLGVKVGLDQAYYQSGNPSKYNASAEHQYEDQCDVCRSLLLFPNSVSGATDQQKANCQPGKPDWCDLAAQESMANSTARLIPLAVWQIVLSIIGLFLLILNAALMARANKIARDDTTNNREIATELSAPFISLVAARIITSPSRIAQPVFLREYGVSSIGYQLEIVNVGKSLCFEIVASAYLRAEGVAEGKLSMHSAPIHTLQVDESWSDEYSSFSCLPVCFSSEVIEIPSDTKMWLHVRVEYEDLAGVRRFTEGAFWEDHLSRFDDVHEKFRSKHDELIRSPIGVSFHPTYLKSSSINFQRGKVGDENDRNRHDFFPPKIPPNS